MHPLDNLIWQALNTRQAHFAETRLEARRFTPEVSPLAAFKEETPENYVALAELVGRGNTTVLFSDTPYEPREGWHYHAGAPMLEMVAANGVASNPSPHSLGKSDAQNFEILELSVKDSPDMIELTHLTKPGPFSSRTHELGIYLGIRDIGDGKLVAMAGERLKVPGFTEVSAVCTHPDHTGKGYAAILMSEVMRRIRERHETPFLHVRQDNTRAIDLYQRLGYAERKLMYFAVLKKE